MWAIGDNKYVDIPLDYVVSANYKSREHTGSIFSKKGKQAHELMTKILLSKTDTAGSYSKFERVFIYAITNGMSVNWPMSILYRFLKVSKHMVCRHLIMEICREYELDLEGFGVKHGIEYNVIESRIFRNAYFHRLHYEDKSKLGKYHKLKPGEVRVKGPNNSIFS